MRYAGISTPDWIEQDGFYSQKDNAKKYLIKSSWNTLLLALMKILWSITPVKQKS